MTANTDWSNFSKLVEATMCVESALAKGKTSSKEKKLSKEPTRTRVALLTALVKYHEEVLH
ncbi:hypothetical protein Csa_022071 [Cucumis sativus]|uniref:Uncharacterized protein n=1 Tax=Cucumis sativus TaxID=3659 RepID=A0A0A0LQZ5_CUCSA|nr:hypothetical protein Csa_022071 [Cucumis sativus]